MSEDIANALIGMGYEARKARKAAREMIKGESDDLLNDAMNYIIQHADKVAPTALRGPPAIRPVSTWSCLQPLMWWMEQEQSAAGPTPQGTKRHTQARPAEPSRSPAAAVVGAAPTPAARASSPDANTADVEGELRRVR
jgi:hypothetical protein